MADLNQVVDLRSASDSRLTYRRAIDGCAGADLDVVLNHHAAGLRNFQPALLFVLCITEAIATDHHVVVNDDTLRQVAIASRMTAPE